nr:tetratricopeptide repeat protein [uncultured Campylobacter sp.]
MINHKLLATLVSGVAFLYSQEISVYDAGNLNSSNPYGLTDIEKNQLQNRQLSQNISSIDSSLDEAMQRIEGLQSIIDGLNSRMAKLEKRVNDLESGSLGNGTSANFSEISELRKYVEESRAIQESNNEKITRALQDMGALIDKSNLKKTTEKIKDEEKSVNNKSEEVSQKSKQDFSKHTNADLSNEAKKFFDAGKLEDAKTRYEYLLSKGHKPAMANFYLGEISYQQKAYNDAIQYYQKSIELYDKADYTPKLLYHTAISFDKIKDTQSANRFYKALKLGYPDSKEAKAAPTRN